MVNSESFREIAAVEIFDLAQRRCQAIEEGYRTAAAIAKERTEEVIARLRAQNKAAKWWNRVDIERVIRRFKLITQSFDDVEKEKNAMLERAERISILANAEYAKDFVLMGEKAYCEILNNDIRQLDLYFDQKFSKIIKRAEYIAGEFA